MKWLGIMLMAALMASAPRFGIAQTAKGKSASPATQPQSLERKGEPSQAAKSYTSEERQAYQRKVAAELSDLNQKIEDLHAKYKVGYQPQTRRTTLKILHSLSKQHFAAQNQLAALEKASEKDWGGLKVEMDKTMKELTKACQEASAPAIIPGQRGQDMMHMSPYEFINGFRRSERIQVINLLVRGGLRCPSLLR